MGIEMPDLAPYPEPDPPLSEAESETKRLENADARWQRVLASFPDAVRPADPFEAYVTDENRNDVLRACYEAAGLQIEKVHAADNADGSPDSIGWTGSGSEAELIAAYACDTAYPTKTTRPAPNDTELGWIYDYLTDFYAPCLAANGIEVPEPPEREVWVESYPGFAWFPSVGDDPRFMDRDIDAALQNACPDPDGYLLTVARSTE
ncbi:hypothetical protein [Agromyces italicus]|uniref:hypothetical protein n=1 Tax=Agromyces italicus TaxID=279572 RepID=UPI0012F8CB2D|nr:hypothetical protein [Agromyces italicus]